jgi:predicted dehydrogenase
MKNTRRNFLKKISVAGILTPLITEEALAYPVITERKLRVALCGLGSYATNQLAPGIEKSKNCELVGIVTGTPEKAAKWKEKYKLQDKNIYNYENFDQIATNPDIDVVYIVLPNSMHADFVIRTAKAGKHVITEKPMSISVKEAKEMIEFCQKAGVKLGVGYRLHYEPFTQEIMRLVKDKDFGKVKFVETKFAWRNRNPNAWRMQNKYSGGGALMDVGIYCINASRYATGEEPISVTAQAVKTEPEIYRDIEETILWQLKFRSGAIASGMSSYATNAQKLSIHYENGGLDLAPAYDYGPLKGSTNKGPLEMPVVHHQAYQMDGFADAILNNKPILTPGEEGLKDMIIIEAIKKAAKTGKEVKINIL